MPLSQAENKVRVDALYEWLKRYQNGVSNDHFKANSALQAEEREQLTQLMQTWLSQKVSDMNLPALFSLTGAMLLHQPTTSMHIKEHRDSESNDAPSKRNSDMAMKMVKNSMNKK